MCVKIAVDDFQCPQFCFAERKPMPLQLTTSSIISNHGAGTLQSHYRNVLLEQARQPAKAGDPLAICRLRRLLPDIDALPWGMGLPRDDVWCATSDA